MSDGRVFLITGASSGIGAATARVAAAAGHRLVLGARSLERLARSWAARSALAAACDVIDLGSLEALVATALERFGRSSGSVPATPAVLRRPAGRRQSLSAGTIDTTRPRRPTENRTVPAARA